MSHAAPVRLRTEYLENPLGLDELQPRFSWQCADDRRGARQTAYQLVVAHLPEDAAAGRGGMWDSGQVTGNATSQIAYDGQPLEPRTRYYWSVRSWDADNEPSPWSEPAWWETGRHEEEWTAHWLAMPPASEEERPATYLRRTFHVAGEVERARVYATARGVYELRFNGERVGEALFAPGWTDYNQRLHYQTYDVTELAATGDNVIGAVLGDGWYCGYLSIFGKNLYGPYPQFLAELHIEYADGRHEVVRTDDAWEVSDGPVRSNDFQMGETYDARRELGRWDRPGEAKGAWREPEVTPLDDTMLIGQYHPPVRGLRELAPVAVSQPAGGAYVFDLGQNMVGWARLRVAGEGGTTVRLRFAEMLNPDGTLYTENLRAAKCTDYYTLKGGGPEVYEPRFTFHGFRYVEVAGYPGEPGFDAVTGVHMNTDCAEVGRFECSDPLVNQIQSNILWSQRGNFLEVPTDCPQRDERLGWTGDAQVFIRTACWNMDAAAFYTKWLTDLRDAQSEAGAYPDVAPRVPLGEGNSAWGDAGVICPWYVYRVYGDTRILQRHYDSMTQWIAYCEEHSNGLIRPEESCFFADWLAINAETPKDLVGTAYFARVTRLMSAIAAVLGRRDDAARYEALFDDIRRAFQQAFVGLDGSVKGETQTGYLLALRYDLVPPELREAVAKRLVADIRARGGHLSTGFLGIRELLPGLTEAGETDLAYKLLLNTTFPSWGYEIEHGATTIWEHWNGWTEEGGFQNPEMNSFNHYSFGSVGEWLYSVPGGLSLDAEVPAFRRFRVAPAPGGGLTSARASHESLHGRIECAWRLEEGGFAMELRVPPNTGAAVRLPLGGLDGVTEGGVALAEAEGVSGAREVGGAVEFECGAGQYAFKALR